MPGGSRPSRGWPSCSRRPARTSWATACATCWIPRCRTSRAEPAIPSFREPRSAGGLARAPERAPPPSRAGGHDEDAMIAIYGAGAIGGLTGACLARAGEDVLLVDKVAEHVEA